MLVSGEGRGQQGMNKTEERGVKRRGKKCHLSLFVFRTTWDNDRGGGVNDWCVFVIKIFHIQRCLTNLSQVKKVTLHVSERRQELPRTSRHDEDNVGGN